jgi:hypothetical protein
MWELSPSAYASRSECFTAEQTALSRCSNHPRGEKDCQITATSGCGSEPSVACCRWLIPLPFWFPVASASPCFSPRHDDSDDVGGQTRWRLYSCAFTPIRHLFFFLPHPEAIPPSPPTNTSALPPPLTRIAGALSAGPR